jgi:hypothetical protein
MAQNGDMDEALAGMAANNPNRQPMGTEAVQNISVAPALKGTLVPKKNVAAGDPTVMQKPSRSNVPNQAVNRNGASYGIRVNYTMSNSPEAGATQANGRIFKSATNRSRFNFDDGAGSSS